MLHGAHEATRAVLCRVGRHLPPSASITRLRHAVCLARAQECRRVAWPPYLAGRHACGDAWHWVVRLRHPGPARTTVEHLQPSAGAGRRGQEGRRAWPQDVSGTGALCAAKHSRAMAATSAQVDLMPEGASLCTHTHMRSHGSQLHAGLRVIACPRSGMMRNMAGAPCHLRHDPRVHTQALGQRHGLRRHGHVAGSHEHAAQLSGLRAAAGQAAHEAQHAARQPICTGDHMSAGKCLAWLDAHTQARC